MNIDWSLDIYDNYRLWLRAVIENNLLDCIISTV